MRTKTGRHFCLRKGQIGRSALKFFAIRPIRWKCKPPCKHITSYLPAFQAISVIRPPGLPAEKADRRTWRMMAIVRRFVFCKLSGIKFHQNNLRRIITAMHIGTIGLLLLTGRDIYIPFAHNTNNSKIENIKNHNTRSKPTG